MKIRIVNTVVAGVLGDDIVPPVPDFVEPEVDWLDDGPTSIECRADEAIAVPAVLERVRAAAGEVDGIVLNCFMDPGLEAARELVHIPVAGPAQSAMTLAATLGQTFSVVLPAATGVPIVVDQATRYVGRERLASVRSVEMPVAELHDHDRLVDRLCGEGQRAVTDDGAHVVVLGCTGMCTVTSAVQRLLAERGHDVPVVDPTLAAVGNVVAQVLAHVHHSGAAYAVPSWHAIGAA
jgi:allantoin racemase